MDIDWNTVIWVASTILSTIIGGILSWLAARSNEAQREGRRFAAEQARSQAERRATYVKLLELVREASEQDYLKSDIETRLISVLYEIELLAPVETREHALALGSALTGDIKDDEREAPYSLATIEERRERFVESVRNEFGIRTIYAPRAQPARASVTLPRALTLSTLPSTQIPLPFSTGGIGLLIAFAAPGGMRGWHGFLIGFATGAVLLVFASGRPVRSDRLDSAV